jgi:hypothetical protein
LRFLETPIKIPEPGWGRIISLALFVFAGLAITVLAGGAYYIIRRRAKGVLKTSEMDKYDRKLKEINERIKGL